MRLALWVGIQVLVLAIPRAGAGKPLSAYFLPMPSVCPLSSTTWGDKAVLPRDACNGMEDPLGTQTNRCQWMYWDGKIIKGPDGRYHMFADRWAHSAGMNGWYNSDAIHAVSPALLGRYEDKGFAFNDGPSAAAPHKGHNVTASELPDGTYVLIVNEIVPFTIFTATSLDGPWKNRGHAVIDKNGVPLSIPPPGDQNLESNVSFTVRHDGNYQIVQRHGIIAISTTGLLGPYKVQQPTTTYAAAEAVPSTLASIYPNRKKHLSSFAPGTVESTYVYAEDPIIWYSGGQYHVVYNYPDDRVAYHLTSVDGIHDWVDRGLAFDPRDTQPLFRTSDGNANRWHNIERPNVILENGHVTHFTFAVSDVFKMNISGNSYNCTKVVVVPFDGEQFDKDTGRGANDAGVDGGGDGGPAVRDAGLDRGVDLPIDGAIIPSGGGGSPGTGGIPGSGGAGGNPGTGGGVAPASGGRIIATGGSAGNPAVGGIPATSVDGGPLPDAAGPAGGAGGSGGIAATGGMAGGSRSGGSTGPIAGSGGIAATGGTPSTKEAGCSCALAGPSTPRASASIAEPAAIFGVLFALAIRRRRR